jgi:hypothetical protein
MAKYKTIPAEVDARQYTGGEKNGKTLEAWVNSVGGDAKWSPENVFEDLTLPEEFYLGKSPMHMNWSLIIGQWLVLEDGFIAIYPDEVFKTKFEKA